VPKSVYYPQTNPCDVVQDSEASGDLARVVGDVRIKYGTVAFDLAPFCNDVDQFCASMMQ
jgi:hypothetical protein